MKQLQRLLFLQGNRCFFCGQVIPDGEASVEHLIATSNGGTNDDENCVVCCKTVNAALGNLSVKAKLQAILNHRGQFACPAFSRVAEIAPTPNALDGVQHERVAQVLADLKKRGPSRPRRLATLKNTMNSVFQMSLSDAELEALLASLQALGYVMVESTKVSYALPTDV